ncbi:transposase [Variovorax sp. NFACC27]|uniref:transposase n=1 Tax=Variovorax sp. NFACC27 TaxID=1566274 RepID=UPI003AAD3BCC
MTSGAKADGRFDKSDFIYIAKDDEYLCPAGQRAIFRFSTVEKSGLHAHLYWTSACPSCPLKPQCTPSAYRRVRRWEHEAVLERAQQRLDRKPDAMTLRRRTVEHVFGTLKHWMGSTHFLTKTLANVGTEMSLHVLAYNMKRVISILGMSRTMKAMRLIHEPLCLPSCPSGVPRCASSGPQQLDESVAGSAYSQVRPFPHSLGQKPTFVIESQQTVVRVRARSYAGYNNQPWPRYRTKLAEMRTTSFAHFKMS